MTYTPPPSPSPELRTALAFVDAVNAKDADALRALFAEDGTHQFYPPMAANPARSRDDFVDFFALSMKGLELHVRLFSVPILSLLFFFCPRLCVNRGYVG
jgi:hypothetical protein